ncbi:hypothetical protein IH601_11690 [Candidatus Bipolaricaulota bacterium]|jgi:hypothetical protein|nr:hypothetical protein [Candidatus Bipolaricaulota bacterium]TFH08942.1 MAG: hypothetical protein E4H08_06820 [Candidatus Atribacteria bacterium]
MKTIMLLVLAGCLLTVPAFAESESTALETSDIAYVGGGGPIPTLLFLNLDDLNGAITDAGYPQINQVLFAMGGGGYGGAMDGLRIGGFGVSGDNMSSSGARSVSFDMSYGGMIIEKAVQSDEDFTVVLGTLLGYGGLDLRFINNLPGSFEEALATPFISSMTKEFFAVQPYVAFESKPCSWMWARFQLGFLWTLADNWAFEDAEFAGPPRTLGGLSASLMIRFGGGSGPMRLGDLEAALDDLATELEALGDDSSDATSVEVDD